MNTIGQNSEVQLKHKHGRLMTWAAYASVFAGALLTIIKLIAFIFTGSVALLTSLIDSMIDVVASLINMVAVKQSLIPADKEHRFGHGKVESLAGLAQAAFICGSVIFILFESVSKLVNPVKVEHGVMGIGVMLISIVVTIVLVLFQRHVIRKTGSLTISADSLHYASDLWFNISVIIAIVLSYYFDFILADPVIALGIAVYIIYNAWHIAMTCLDQLMDRELPDEDRENIRQIAIAHSDVKDVHGLRSRSSGRDIFIQLHLEMDHKLDLETAHAIALDVEKKICAAYPQADVIIHQDPDTEINKD
jgi:ferrous-iron efflux pump FieF